MKILLIRANRNGSDVTALGRYGIDSFIDPYLELTAVENREGALRMLAALEATEPKWFVLTSTNALDFFSRLLEPGAVEAAFAAGLRAKSVQFAAIGDQTAMQLRQLGAHEVLIADSNTGASLAQTLVKTRPMPVVIPSGSIAMKDIPNTLSAGGFEIVTEVVYQTEVVATAPRSVAQVAAGEFDGVLLRSPSAARAFLSFNSKPTVALLAAGTSTARQLRELGHEPALIASNPNPTTVAAEISEFLKAGRR
jgi:uroporphyrinogen-III synthase